MVDWLALGFYRPQPSADGEVAGWRWGQPEGDEDEFGGTSFVTAHDDGRLELTYEGPMVPIEYRTRSLGRVPRTTAEAAAMLWLLFGVDDGESESRGRPAA